MTYKAAIEGLSAIESDCRKLRLKGFQSKWFVYGMRGLEQHASGLRFAIESIQEMTAKMQNRKEGKP